MSSVLIIFFKLGIPLITCFGTHGKAKMLRARKSSRKSTSSYAASSPATSRLGRNRTSGALPLNNHLHCPQGIRLHQLKTTFCPRFTNTTIHLQFQCLEHQPQVLCQMGSNRRIHYLILYPQLLVIIYYISPLLIRIPHSS